MMNGEIPSVPITTLAGLSSLTDLLPELPLPSPLPATLGNKSLLFNTQAADEARRLLSTPDENLMPQLLHALSQTSTDHIELKDKSIGDDIEGDVPALLQAILAQNPNVFKQKGQLNRMGGMSPRQPMQPSPYYQQSPDAMVQHSPYQRGHTSMQGSPSAGFPQGSPSRFPPGSPASKFPQSSPQRFPQSPNKFQQYPFQQPQQQQNVTQGSPASAAQASINGYPGSQYSPATAPSPAVPAASPGVMSPPQSRARPLPHSPGAAVVPTATSPGSSGKPFPRQKQQFHQQFQQPQQQQQQQQLQQNQEQQPLPPPPPPPVPKKDDQIVPVMVSQVKEGEAQNEVEKVKPEAAHENSVGEVEENMETVQHSDDNDDVLIPIDDDVQNKRTDDTGSNSSLEQSSKRRLSSGASVKSGPVVLLKPLTEADKKLAQKSASAFQLKGPVPRVRLERLDLSVMGDDSPGREKLSLKLKKRKAGKEATMPSYDIVSASDGDRITLKLSKSREEERRQRGRPRKNYDEDLPPLDLDEPITPPSPVRRGRKRQRSVTSSSAAELESIDSIGTTSSDEFPRKRARKNRKGGRRVLDDEELMEGATFKRFCHAMETVFENSEEMDVSVEIDEEGDGECSQDLLIPKALLGELSSQAAKLKSMEVMSKISSEKLVRLLNILERNIRDGCKLQPTMNQDDEDKQGQKLWRELTMDRVTRSIDASLTAMYIMTSPNMPKEVYIEDVIERLGVLVKFQLLNTIYPEYDPVYRVNPHNKDGFVSNMRMKRARAHGTKEKSIIAMYNKLCEIVSNLADLMEIQTLTDTTVLLLSSIGLAPFFVENVSELQLSAMKLITGVFSNYEKHRQLILEDILASLARLPSSKKNLRNFRLNSEDNIQMVTALVLQLIQCIVTLPSTDGEDRTADEDDEDDDEAIVDKGDDVDKDVVILNQYETSLRVAQNFLSVFLKKCTSRDEEDYRPLFENFVQDLLSTVNKPEWPAAEVLLSLLGRLLVHGFSNRSNDMTLRVSSLDYLGQVASRLRRDAVSSQLDQSTIDAIVDDVHAKSAPVSDDEDSNSESSSVNEKKVDAVTCLQRAMLDYLAYHGQNEPALKFARQFYIGQWFRDTTTEVEKSIKAHENNESTTATSTTDVLQSSEKRKSFLVSMIKVTIGPFASIRQSHSKLTYENACLVARYLTSNRPFSQSFDIYLGQILRVLSEQAVAVRTKAVRCLTQVVEADPSMLARHDMEHGVHGRFMDHSTSVREAAVELVGKFVLKRPELIPQYYNMLIERILDTGISVRKRVIKILRDICIEIPDFPKVPEMCVKMIRRVNDEEGIKKLVNDTFQKMWFTPLRGSDTASGVLRRVHHITDVVAACKETGYEWFEQLLCNSLVLPDGKSESALDGGRAGNRKLVRTENDNYNKPVFRACEQIVDCLVENVLRLEEKAAELSAEGKATSSNRLVSCMQTLFLFAKIRPELLVPHALTLQPYLSTRCSTQGDYLVLYNVAKTLELVVPLMDHPSEVFLATLEEDLMKLIIKHGQMVLQSCVSCLASVVNNVTHNFKLVKDCFQKFFGVLSKIKNEITQNPDGVDLAASKPSLLRSLFTVGLFCRHFNFEKDIKASSKVSVKDRVLDVILFFVAHEDEEIQLKALQGLGFFCVTYSECMLGRRIKELYNNALNEPDASVKLKIQVLRNLTTYLTEEEERMRKADAEWKKVRQQEDLKELGDIHSGMSSSVMQIFIKQIMEEFFHTQSSVRMCALQVVHLILRQGLVHPVQCVPYLVAIGTDYHEHNICVKADQQLSEIDSKYPGFIHMKALAGIKMSFRLQKTVATESEGQVLVRGQREGESFGSLCSHLYTLIRSNRQHRRALLLNLLNLYDEQSKNELSLLVYVADNLAYFPYLVQDEPLFIMHHIEIIVSVSGANLLQSFKECLFKAEIQPEHTTAPTTNGSSSRPPSRASSGEDQSPEPLPPPPPPVIRLEDEDEEDVEILMSRIPEDPSALLDCCAASQACMVLLVLKQHLKDMYGFRDSTIHRYSPTESAKVYDKALNRKQGVKFEPARALQYLCVGIPSAPLSDQAKKDIVNEYLDFKQLMEVLDPAEDDEIEEAGQTGQTTPRQGQEAANSKLITREVSVVLERHDMKEHGGGEQTHVNDSKEGVNETKEEAGKEDASNTGKEDVSITGRDDVESTDGGLMPPTPASGNIETSVGSEAALIPLPGVKHRAKPKPKARRRKPKQKKRKRFSLDITDDSDSSDPDFRV